MRELWIRSNGLRVSERKERGRAHREKWLFEAQGKPVTSGERASTGKIVWVGSGSSTTVSCPHARRLGGTEVKGGGEPSLVLIEGTEGGSAEGDGGSDMQDIQSPRGE